jgi:hypothetical protein
MTKNTEPMSQETKDLISKALKEYYKNHISAHKGKPSPKKGKPISDEQKSKISASNKGKVRSAETKSKMSEAKKGRTFTQEHKDNMRKAQLDRWSKLKSDESTSSE